jgi:hypothetical protein
MWCALLRAIKPLIDNLPATALSYNEAFPIRLLRWRIPVSQTPIEYSEFPGNGVVIRQINRRSPWSSLQIHTEVKVRYFDFNSWQGILTSLFGLAMVTLIGVGIRVLMMQTIQQRRERMNRQINERLKTLIGAYKTLGGSFTGQLTVDPTHLRDLRVRESAQMEDAGDPNESKSSDRSRRIRDAVEAALSDIILLGTEEHVRLAGRAAIDMVAGRPALDLGPIPDDVDIPLQGPTRAQSSGSRNKSDGDKAGNKNSGIGDGAGVGMGVGLGMAHKGDDHSA